MIRGYMNLYNGNELSEVIVENSESSKVEPTTISKEQTVFFLELGGLPSGYPRPFIQWIP